MRSKVSRCTTTPAITSAIGGQPCTLMIGLPVTTWWMGRAFVGFGRADWTQPAEAQLPHATTAFAPSTASRTMSRALRPPMTQ